MKPLHFAAAAAALAFAAACTQPAETVAPETPAAINAASGEYAIDPTHTTVTLRVKHFGLSNYVLRFDRVTGALNFNAEDPTASTINATVDVSSLSTPFNALPATATGGRDFNAELINSEWLDALQFPTATFVSRSAERTGPNTGRVTGDLTIKGVTHPATFDVTYNASHAQHPMGFPLSLIGFSAKTTISRAAYGVNVLPESSAGAGDGVADQIELLIDAEFTRPVTTPADQAQ